MFETSHETYSFVDFTLDVSSHRFLRGQNEIKLTTQPFKALLYLVKNPNKLITKDELINAVRGKDVNLTLDEPKKWIDHIRAALGDRDQMIEIVRGEGWRFNVDVKVNSPTGYTTASRDPAHEVNSDTRTAAAHETDKMILPHFQCQAKVEKFGSTTRGREHSLKKKSCEEDFGAVTLHGDATSRPAVIPIPPLRHTSAWRHHCIRTTNYKLQQARTP